MASITELDLSSMISIIDICYNKGIFRQEEIEPVNGLYTKLTQNLDKYKPKQNDDKTEDNKYSDNDYSIVGDIL
jgi:hypothetical protein